MEAPDLLPCPFCGSKTVGHVNDKYAYIGNCHEIIVCTGCGASGANVSTREEAAAAWNRRADLVPQVPAGWTLAISAVNHLEAQSIDRVIAHAKRAHHVDIVIRKDGKEFRYEGDWIKCMVRTAPEPPGEKT